MTHLQQKIFTSTVIAFVTFLGFESLVYILNLNQIRIFVHVAFWLSAFLIFMMALLFDFHFKNPNSLSMAKKKHENVVDKELKYINTLSSALWNRLEHITNWRYLTFWLHYAVVPGLVFWATVAIFYTNMGQSRVQQVFLILSSVSLTVNFWYLKEVFHKKAQRVEHDLFVPLTIIKIYTSLVVYAAATVIVKRDCLDAKLYVLLIALLTFSLIYQSLFQHEENSPKNLSIALFISIFLGLCGYGVLIFWGFNYFTAAAFLTTIYNLCWGIFHHHIDKTISWKSFWEIILFSLLICVMIFSVTNFKARILNNCEYGATIKSQE